MTYQAMSGIVPIRDVFLNENDRKWGALRFRNGYVFFRVTEAQIVQYNPYVLIDESGTAVTIARSLMQ